MEIYRRNYNNEKYFTLEGCAELERPYTEKATITKNIYIKKIYLLINFGIENPPLLID